VYRIATALVADLLAIACTATPTSSPSAPASSPPASRPAITAITAGGAHTCALTGSGGVNCWGYHAFGGAPGAIGQSIVPVEIAGLASGVLSIEAGRVHTCAVTSSGGARCWGDNNNGQLGDGTTTHRSTPVEVVGLVGGVSAVSAGSSHSCGLTVGGGVRCWGANYIGQLGDGTTTESLAPVDVDGLASGARAIAASDESTCALTSEGGVKCWGYNNWGQLGNHTTTDSLVPVSVWELGSGISAITSGRAHTCALTAGGGVKCWGSNSFGQLGDGTRTQRTTPVDVHGLSSGIAAISAGGDHTCALTGGGHVKCWGYNRAGQLGTGTTTDSQVPVAVPGLGISVIAAGDQHSCAATSSGTVGCWGDNMYWQLGSRRVCGASSSVPVEVAFASPASSNGPTGAPIEHATGPADVVLRFDIGPDLILPSQLTDDVFRPGPEFTLYGDGTAIFRNERTELPAAEGPIVRARPFFVAQLDEDEMRSLLVFALGEGGLGEACDLYEAPATDDATSSVFTIRAGGLDKRVEVVGSANPLEAFADYLRNFDGSASIPTQTWVPARYRGTLIEAAGYIEIGLLPDPRDAGIVPWPWPGLAPKDLQDSPNSPRVMSAAEAAVHGLSDNGGVVKRVYLLGPDGATVYVFALWPIFPDETS
jgi:alpha-tubulin suppressor-like RCC1 family protein